jgi:chromosome segregation protein
MIIKKLELQGFKSFPDRTRILFHPGITAIIGPNGTGKSNIVDALLWTLRGRRLKTQRSERGSENIFNGNNKRAPLSLADAVLVLGDEKDKDAEDLIINHRLFRSGEGEYRLNGKAVRLKDIQEALYQSAIGDTEYFVIEQGSIGVFLSSKPIEKRLLLEEAAGTAFYKDKKRQAQNKLQNSEQNLVRLEDIIIEVEKATNSLKRQASAAIRYRKLREQIRELTLQLYRQKIDALEHSQRETSSEHRSRLERENHLLANIKAQEKASTAKRQEAWDFEKELKDKHQDVYSLRSELSRLEAEKDREERRLSDLAEKKKKDAASRSEVRQELEALDKELKEVAGSQRSLTEAASQKQDAYTKAEQTSNAAREDMAESEKRIERLRDEYYKQISGQTEIRNDAAKVEKELEHIDQQELRLQNEHLSQQALLQENEKALMDREKRHNDAQEEMRHKEKSNAGLTRELESLEIEIADLEEKARGLTREREKSLHHLHALEKLREQEGRAQETTELPETIGLLADLLEGSTENGFLIDVFYKEEAKATLVDAPGFLKNLGEDRLQGQYLLLHPESSKPAASLVYQDSRVLGLLKSQLKADSRIKHRLGTLPEAAIVKDLKTAVSLWLEHPRSNFVTVDGDLLLASGLVKAGQKQEGLIALTQQIRSLQKKAETLQNEITPLESQLRSKNAAQEKLQSQLQEGEAQLTRLTLELESLDRGLEFDRMELQKAATTISLLEKERSNLSQEKKELATRSSSLQAAIAEQAQLELRLKQNLQEEEGRIETLRGETEYIHTQFFGLKTEIDVLQEKINSAGLLEQRLQERRESLKTRLANLEKDIDSDEGNKQSLRSRIKDIEGQIARAEKETKDKASDLTEEESQLSRLQREQRELEERLVTMREEYETAKETRVTWEVSKAERERDLVNLEESCWQELKKTLAEVKAEIEPQEIDIASVENSLDEAKDKLERLKAVNLMAEEEYLEQKQRYDFLKKEQGDLIESIASTREAIKKIDQESKSQFLKALIEVNKNFQDVFSQLFKGGIAELKLSDEEDPLESGIEIIAQPPGKRVQSLSLLSGGERTLTSLAFFFALFRYKPSPFCILDEVDAALDETNLVRFLDLMRAIKHQTQFIIITHNFKTMEVADYIYGTTMAEPNITSIYSVKIEDKQVTANK